MNPRVEAHTHLPESVGYVIAIIVGLILLIFDYYAGSLLDWVWVVVIGIVGTALIVVGFLKLLFG